VTASLHTMLFFLSRQVIRSLPVPVLRALDAWSHRVARRRALERQRRWQQQRLAAQADRASHPD
jgi:hypothetical protein